LLSQNYLPLISFAKGHPSLRTAINDALKKNLGDKAKDLQKLAGSLLERAAEADKRLIKLLPASDFKNTYLQVDHDTEFAEVTFPDKNPAPNQSVIYLKVFRLLEKTTNGTPIASWRVYKIELKDGNLQFFIKEAEPFKGKPNDVLR